MKKKKTKYIIFGDVFGVLAAVLIFLVPFYFMLVNSLKSKQEAAILSISWPEEMHFENYMEVISYNNYQFLRAFKNSILLTLFTVAGLLIVGGMAGYVIQRRNDRRMKTVQWVLMLGDRKSVV